MELTKATDIFLKHYNLWTKDSPVKQIRDYNNHKIRHSIGVLEYGRLILLKMWDKVNDELKLKSELCFILHDIARFYQNDWKKILANNIFEHWDAWYNLAKKDWYSEDICLAIKYHNKKDYEKLFEEKTFLAFSEEEKEKAEFLVKITRDADKLENMIYMIFDTSHILFLDKENEWDVKKEFISSWVLEDILDKRVVERNNINTKIDKILAIVSWIFNINFYETKKILKQNKFLEKIWVIIEKNIIPSLNSFPLAKGQEAAKKDKKNLEKILDICKKELKALSPESSLPKEEKGATK